MKDNVIRLYSDTRTKEKIERKARKLGLSASSYLLQLAEADTKTDTSATRLMRTIRLVEIKRSQDEMKEDVENLKLKLDELKKSKL
jgi:hypothetical protein